MSIREASIPSTWKKVYKLNYDFLFEELKMNGVLGITESVPINKGLFAICGRNGVGKSTVLAAIKDSLGISLSIREEKKINGENVEVRIKCENSQFILQNIDGQRFIDLNKEHLKINIIDYEKLIIINNFLEQDNLDEILEQFEEESYQQEDLESLSYLIGKEYDEVYLTVIEDEDTIIPYFKVKCSGVEYNSLTMGTGEHFLFYTYWVLRNIASAGVVILEEPEVFISVPSQINLMNFIAKKMKEKRFTVLVVTHSPFVLQNIATDNILIMSSDAQNVATFNVNFEEEYLQELGMPILKKGTILFEDTLALEFFKALCKEKGYIYPKIYNLSKMGGHGKISSVLSIPVIQNIDHKIVGIYDGDMRESSDINRDNLNLEYYFLPGENNLEEDFKKITRENSNINYLAERFDISISDFSRVLSRISGKEKHDWFNDLVRQTDLPISQVVKTFTRLWIQTYGEEVEEFFQQIETL